VTDIDLTLYAAGSICYAGNIKKYHIPVYEGYCYFILYYSIFYLNVTER
jgi:hypothetical protein